MTDTILSQEMQQGRVYPTYDVMISRLFKTMGGFHDHMHAAIGMAGEAAELLNANGRKNILEECSDIEFYIEAMKQRIPNVLSAVTELLQDPNGMRPDNAALLMAPTLHNVATNIVTVTGEILDITKKSWVYNKDFDTKKVVLYLMILENQLDFLYGCIGTTRADVQHANQVKLIGPGGRFESGFYSDDAAIARADKVGEGRSFIGQPG